VRVALVVSTLVLFAACSAPTATGPSATPAAATSAPPTPSPAACAAVPPHQAAGPVLYSTDLSAPCAGRVLGSTAGDSLSATPDLTGYRIVFKFGPGVEWGAGPDAADYAPAKTSDDVRGEVDVEQVSGSDKTLVGFECRVQLLGGRETGGYRLMVARSGAYFIERFGDSPKVLTSGSSPATVAATNHLMAECLGSKLALFLNGKEVASVSDGAITTGLIGIYARNQDAASTELVFKNLVVTGP
jgi:hypothetical protein